jgi:hypothetical protein
MGSFSGPVPLQANINAYNQNLALSTQNYSNILNAYSTAQQNAGNELQGIQQGYSGLGKDINRLAEDRYNIGARDIRDNQQQAFAKQREAAVNSGFRSSAQLALQNQTAALYGRNIGDLNTNILSQVSDRQTQIGLAGLQARQSGLGLQTGLAQSYMGNLAGFHFPTPTNLYGQQSVGDSGGYGGRGGVSGGSSGGGSPFSPWLSNSGVPMYSGGAGNAMGYSGAYAQPSYYQSPYGNAGVSDPYLNQGNNPMAGFGSEAPDEGSGEGW